MKQREAVFLYTDLFEDYHYPVDCPFKTERATQVRKTLVSMGLLGGPGKKIVKPEPAERSILELIHTPFYLDTLKNAANGGWDIKALEMGIGGPETPVFKGMYEYNALAAGASLKSAQMLLAGETDIAFNPWGGLHHAEREFAAGFCYINDVAIACKYLAQQGKRVLYLDVDVHHGDGVQHAFYDRSDVMTISMHETGKNIFPGTGFEDEIGVGEGTGFCANFPFPEETYDAIYLRCYEEAVVPLIKAFDGDIIVLELGADGLAGDPLAHLKLTNHAFVHILESLLELDKPLLVTGGGGYNVENTTRAWSLAWAVLTGEYQDMADLHLGLGGVMMESTDWLGGLRDRELPPTVEQKQKVDPQVEATIQKIKETLFPLHGIS